MHYTKSGCPETISGFTFFAGQGNFSFVLTSIVRVRQNKLDDYLCFNND